MSYSQCFLRRGVFDVLRGISFNFCRRGIAPAFDLRWMARDRVSESDRARFGTRLELKFTGLAAQNALSSMFSNLFRKLSRPGALARAVVGGVQVYSRWGSWTSPPVTFDAWFFS